MGREAIIAKMGLDTKQFSSKARAVTKKIGSMFKSIGGAAVGMLGLGSATSAIFKTIEAINLGSKLSDLATQTMTAVEAFQVLKFAATRAGVSQEILERALRNVNKRSQEAADGNARYANAMRRLGLNVQKFNALPSERKMEAIALAVKNAKDQQQAYVDVSAILGDRAGPKMLEVLDQLGTEGYDKLAKKAKDAGQVMSEDVIEDLDRAADEIEFFKNRVTVIFGNLFATMRGNAQGKAAITLLGKQLQLALGEAVEGFGRMFVERWSKAEAFIKAGFKTIANEFGNSLISQANWFISKVNKVAEFFGGDGFDVLDSNKPIIFKTQFEADVKQAMQRNTALLDAFSSNTLDVLRVEIQKQEEQIELLREANKKSEEIKKGVKDTANNTNDIHKDTSDIKNNTSESGDRQAVEDALEEQQIPTRGEGVSLGDMVSAEEEQRQRRRDREREKQREERDRQMEIEDPLEERFQEARDRIKEFRDDMPSAQQNTPILRQIQQNTKDTVTRLDQLFENA